MFWNGIEMSEIVQVILKLSSNHKELMDRLLKFHESINQAFLHSLNSDMYLETIKDGLIYIFRDFNSFKTIHKPVPKIPKFVKRRIFKINPIDEDLILGNVLRKESDFPSDGLKYFITSETHNNKILFPFIRDHYQSIHPDINTSIDDKESRIIINFKNYDSFYFSFILMNYWVDKALAVKQTSISELYALNEFE